MDHGSKVIAALEAHAGRPLSDTELLHGVEHKELRTAAEQIADNRVDPPQHFDSREQNPYTLALNAKRNKRESREEMLKRKEAEWEVRKAAEKVAAEFQGQPERVKLKAKIDALIQAAKFNDELTQEDMDDLLTIRYSVETSDIMAEPQVLLDAWHGRQRDRIDGEVSKLDEQVAALRKRRDALESRPVTVELPTPTLTATKYPKVAADSPEWEQFASRAQREAKSAAVAEQINAG
ncbi:MAG TPA: hypothetical protein VFE46_03905 [Pirellulales bacterium]|nr:hypothetical protein [Pirellulales bacterium]